MSAKLQMPFRVGEWLVDPSLDTISRGAQTTKLEPRMMRLLTCLAESSGAVVSQERLLAEVWAGVVVGPASVYQAVSQLRRLLGDLEPEPSYIATVPRKGYRLIAPVELVPVAPVAPAKPSLPAGSPQASAPAPASSTGAPMPEAAGGAFPRRSAWVSRGRWMAALLVVCVLVLAAAIWMGWRPLRRWMPLAEDGESIVVLPFIDMSKDKADQPLCDGLTEELSNWLAQIPTLRVVARTSAFALRGLNEDVRAVGNLVGANHVLEGSLLRSGDHVRVIVRLSDARSGYQLWSTEYDQPFDDPIRFQEDIARSVAGSLAIRLTENAKQRLAALRSTSPEAYRLFLLARHYQQDRTADSNSRAIELYQQSLQADPQFALAYVGLAYATINRLHLDRHSLSEASAAAEPLLARAEQLEPDLSELYAVRAALREEQSRTDDALHDLKHAVELNPNDSWAFAELSRLNITQAEPFLALEDVRHALALDPLDYILHARQCLVLQDLAFFLQAGAACERARALHGEGGWDLLVSEWLAWSQGDLVQALDWNAAALKAVPHSLALYERRADFLLTLGLASDARAVLEQARTVTHNDEAANVGLARVAYYEGGADALRAQIAAARLDESQRARTLIDTAYFHLLLGESPVARQLFTHAMQAPDFDASQLNSPWLARWGISDQLILAVVEKQSGDSVAGAQHLQELADMLDRITRAGEERHGIYALKAEVLALMGNQDGAMQSLKRAFELGWRGSWWAQHEPYFAELRSRADFRALLERVDDADRRMQSAVRLAQKSP
jgi:transcriptional activator of cad operon